MSKLTEDQRLALGTAVLDVLETGPLRAYAVTCRVERLMAARASFAFDGRDVERTLQRLRKGGRIETKRSGSFAHWNRRPEQR